MIGGLAAGLLVGALCGAAVAAQPAGPSVNDGVYTEAQAERGRRLFENHCTTCHDTGRFTGSGFVDVWAGQPLSALFEVMSTTMPEDNPGGLKVQEYADILSYFLKLNKYPSGAGELKGTADAMKAIQMEAPKSH